MMKMLGAAAAAVVLSCAGQASALSVVDFEDYEIGKVFSFEAPAGTDSPFLRVTGVVQQSPDPLIGKYLALEQTPSPNFGSQVWMLGHTSHAPTLLSFDVFATGPAHFNLFRSGAPTEIVPGEWQTFKTNGMAAGWTALYFHTSAVYIDNLVFDETTFSSAVPEPAVWGMLVAGFGLAGAALRRRRYAV